MVENSIKAVTKTESTVSLQRVGVWCKPTAIPLEFLSLLSRSPKGGDAE